MNTHGDKDRDWTNVDWCASQGTYIKGTTVSATVNSTQVRAYEFNPEDVPKDALRLIEDLFSAVNQHRKKAK